MASRAGDDGAAGRAERALRVERIREALDGGRYLVDGREVAGKILGDGVLSIRLGAATAPFPGEGPLPLQEGAAAEFLWRGFPGGGGQTK